MIDAIAGLHLKFTGDPTVLADLARLSSPKKTALEVRGGRSK